MDEIQQESPELKEREEHEKNIAERQKKPDIEDVGDAYRYNPDYHRFCDFLEIDQDSRNNYDLANQISLIVDWGKKNCNSDDHVDVSMTIRNLQRYLGLSNLQGPTLVKKLYQWIRLDQDRRRIEKEMQLMVDKGE